MIKNIHKINYKYCSKQMLNIAKMNDNCSTKSNVNIGQTEWWIYIKWMTNVTQNELQI